MAENIELLDNPLLMSGLDKSSMFSLVERLVDMFEEGWRIATSSIVDLKGPFNKIVIAGMGGSAISGDIVNMTLKEQLTVPVIVNRSYICPTYVDRETLFIASSYSGNTEETLSSFKVALTKKAKIVAVTSGGELKTLCEKNGIPFIEVPKGLPPRAALGYLLSSSLSIIYKLGLAANIPDDVASTIKLMKQLNKKLGVACNTRENPAKTLAVKLSKKIPVVMASVDTTYAAGLRWKTQINENSKMSVMFNVFPELNHNDMVNFAAVEAGQNAFVFVILRDEADTEKMKKRIEITKSLISGKIGGIIEVEAEGRSPLEKQMSLILFGDYLSVYLAMLEGVDPTPVDIIERLKRELVR